MDCFGTYFTHAQTGDVTRAQSATEWTASVHVFTHVQTCDVTRVQSASEWTSSVHTLFTHAQTSDSDNSLNLRGARKRCLAVSPVNEASHSLFALTPL